MAKKYFQDFYPDNYAVCYGCGRLNEYGLQIKSYWEGDTAICRYKPQDYHIAIPGYTYGGLIASLIDCHATGTASAAMYRQANRPLGSEPPFRFVTGTLDVRYEAPTPIEEELELRATVVEIKDKRVTVQVELFAEQQRTALGKVIVFQMPEHLISSSAKTSRAAK